ncbi:MAG: EAL domain-containing protein [Inhella sp.]|jgi:diguanylate cyclase (GGDEF)-like protein|uniref:putative bifunctional diguanylate cyclase/phosphodiesterase n=1 Tax=Inhella sp. TaxID=1921806 RepID=UPI0022CA5210|nr:EAL domain-containing protein [Inhella sp.]MCZ8233682.1 EAL domain-containing protein [Inhella sp.]
MARGWRFLDLTRLQGRIVVLFVGLLLLVQIATFGIVQRALVNQTERSVDRELGTAAGVLRTLLQQQAARKTAAVQLLAQDYGFRATLATGLVAAEDLETLRDALDNHGRRIGADGVAYLDPTGRRVVASGMAEAPLPSPRDDGLQLAVLGGRAVQIVDVPVLAPTPIGRVVMVFRLDSGLLEQLKRLTDVDGVLQVHGPQGAGVSLAVEEQHLAMLPAAQNVADDRSGSTTLESADGMQRARWMALLPEPRQPDGEQVRALLWVSYSTAVAPFRQLQWLLLVLNALGVLAFAVGAIVTARRVSRPIGALVRSAERLGGGDYDTPVATPSSLGEVVELAQAFERMREDIGERERQVQRLAFWDPLTGLPNRAQFVQRLHPLKPMALLMLNLDRFKRVNEVLGRDTGDMLLALVAQRLLGCVGGDAWLARIGADEFAIALPGGDEVQARALAQRVLAAFAQPVTLKEQTVDLGAGIGIALALSHARDPEGLLSRAEQAMQAAKRYGVGVQVYDDSLDGRSQATLGLLSELRQALQHGELRLYLQPKLHLVSQQVRGAEALVRWQHPVRGLVPPGLFIPFAEQTGFIRELTRWVLQAALRFAVAARAQGQTLRISVNLSTRDLMDADLPGKIQGWMAEAGADASLLGLEITESAIMDDPSRALATVKELRAQGFWLSIDDFGTGYSSFAYLSQLRVHELKIDQSFVFGMTDPDKPGDRQIVRSIIDLAHNLEQKVVAEGIEAPSALDDLRAWGCDEAQGYFIAKPMPAEHLLGWLAAR